MFTGVLIDEYTQSPISGIFCVYYTTNASLTFFTKSSVNPKRIAYGMLFFLKIIGMVGHTYISFFNIEEMTTTEIYADCYYLNRT